MRIHCIPFLLFFFHYTPTTEIYPLSLHDALPISHTKDAGRWNLEEATWFLAVCSVLLELKVGRLMPRRSDRKSTRLNSSHRCSSYAVFCLKKKTPEDTVEKVPSAFPCKISMVLLN